MLSRANDEATSFGSTYLAMLALVSASACSSSNAASAHDDGGATDGESLDDAPGSVNGKGAAGVGQPAEAAVGSEAGHEAAGGGSGRGRPRS
jgi:hypothetical protein